MVHHSVGTGSPNAIVAYNGGYSLRPIGCGKLQDIEVRSVERRDSAVVNCSDGYLSVGITVTDKRPFIFSLEKTCDSPVFLS